MSTRLLVFALDFYTRADAFAQRHPHYAGKDTIGTRYHVSNAVIACGFTEVNADNLDRVMAALEARAATWESLGAGVIEQAPNETYGADA